MYGNVSGLFDHINVNNGNYGNLSIKSVESLLNFE